MELLIKEEKNERLFSEIRVMRERERECRERESENNVSVWKLDGFGNKRERAPSVSPTNQSQHTRDYAR